MNFGRWQVLHTVGVTYLGSNGIAAYIKERPAGREVQVEYASLVMKSTPRLKAALGFFSWLKKLS